MDVVICSSREDADLARKLDESISRAGFRVRREDGADDDFWRSDAVVDRICTAKAALIIWSRRSAASTLMRAEANAARQQRKLIQVSADGQHPPAPFDQTPYAELAGWRGEGRHPGWQQLVQALGMVSGVPSGSPVAAAPPRQDRPLFNWSGLMSGKGSKAKVARPLTGLLLAALVATAGAAGWMAGRQQAANSDAPRAAAETKAGKPTPAPVDPAPIKMAEAPVRMAPAPATPAAPINDAAREAAPPATFDPAPEPRKPLAETPRPAQAEKKPAKAGKAASRKPAAKAPPRKRIKYVYSENMRLFCERAGRLTPQCKVFRRNAPRKPRQSRPAAP